MLINGCGSRSGKVDVAVADDEEIIITGATNGDGGIGTTLQFVNKTGTTNGWSVLAKIESQGNGTTAAAAFTACGFKA